MSQLDDLKAIDKIDPKLMASHIAELPDQIQAAWAQFQQTSLPTHYVQARQIVVLGMGGSAIGGELAAALAARTSTVPIEIRRDYDLPAYVGKETLVIAVSYSGNTEETLDGFGKAAARGAKLVAISTGGEVAVLARKFQIPQLVIDYASEPRAAIGYLLTGVLTVFSKLRFLPIKDHEIAEAVGLLRDLAGKLQVDVPLAQNLAKSLATKLRDRVPMIMASGTLAPVAKRWKTQFNENSKIAAVAEIFPELSHNTIEGLERPNRQRDAFHVIFLQSPYSHPRNQLRLTLLNRQFAKARIPTDTIFMHPSGSPLAEALQMVLFGDYVSYYLAILAGVDPTPVVSISQLKKDLAQNTWEMDQ